MAELIVEFRGVVTHFKRTPGTPVAKLPAPHRAVVVNADHLPPDLRAKGVKPHKPFLFFSLDGQTPDGRRVPLANGTMLTVKGAAGDVTYDPSYKNDLFRLVTFQPGYEPCLNVVTREQAACYFDLHGGRLSVFFSGQERSVRWTLPVPDGVPPVVVLTRENGRVDELPVPEGRKVVLTQHTVPEASHGPNDFLLHYLSSEVGIPFTPPVPLPGQMEPPTYDQEAMTAACSNSGYP